MLTAEGLAIGYGRKRIGEAISLAVSTGDVVALLGPNGGGKTTLLKTLLGLVPPLGGAVRLDGRPLATIPPRERARHIAYVPQVHAGTFPFLVADVVLMGRVAHAGLMRAPSSADRAAAERAIARLGLSDLAARPYTEISGGERQLVLIARALAQEPRFVILDEPTASLDFGNQGKVMREIRSLASAGLGIVFSTHDPNHARRYASKAVLLHGGRAVASGAVSDVVSERNLVTLYGDAVQALSTQNDIAFLLRA